MAKCKTYSNQVVKQCGNEQKTDGTSTLTGIISIHRYAVYQ
jgi:hypothetical protein